MPCKNKKSGINIWWLLFLYGSIVCMMILYYCLTRHFYPELTNRGLFGDSFGAINTFFTGLTFASLIYTIWVQNKDQQKQVEMTLQAARISALTALIQSYIALLPNVHYQNTRKDLLDKIKKAETELEKLVKDTKTEHQKSLENTAD